MNFAQDLALQHKEFNKQNYDGHNRRSVRTSMRKFQTRRNRRRSYAGLRMMLYSW